MKKIELAIRRVAGLASKLQSNNSVCGCCGMAWNACEAHYTNYIERKDCFALCEWCWSKLTIEERIGYYRRLHSSWVRAGDTRNIWPNIEKAVREGK